MSYILDALKKSEQERRRGQVPDLAAAQVSPERPRRRPVRWPYLLALGLTLHAAVLLWWVAPWRSEKPAPQAEVRVIERIVTVPAPPQAPPQVPVAGHSSPASPSASASVPAPSPPSPRHTAEAGKEAAPPAPAAVAGGLEAVAGNAAPPEEGVPPAPQAEDVPSETPGGQAPADPGQAVLQEALGQYEELLDSGEAPIHPAPQGVPDIVDTRRIPSSVSRMQKEEMRAALKKMSVSKGDERLDVPELSQLSPDLRKQIPPITIALHFYSQTPASRKVSINGKMRREGDEVGEGLTVDEIVRNGVILRYRGDTRFHLPVF